MTSSLPDFYPITAPLEGSGGEKTAFEQSPPYRSWFDSFQRLVAAEPWWVQLRVKSLPASRLEQLSRACISLASDYGVKLILNGPPGLAKALGFSGIHLTTPALMALRSRPLPTGFLVGASCHSAGELSHAAAIGADFACLSPVRRSKHGRDEPVLGMAGFAGLVADCPIPVYALGGMRREDLAQVRAAGGQGVAGISAFWQDK